ncbi:MAG: hypothetical protein ACM3SW_20595 [Actinomycetota bacterium]
MRRIYYLLNRRRLQRELAQDMAVHREMLGEAHRKAFGNPAVLREQAHDAWGWTWLDGIGSPDAAPILASVAWIATPRLGA